MTSVDPLEISVGARTEGRWRRLPPAARIVIVIVCAVVGINLLARFVQESTGGSGTPGGRRSSAYATGDDGLAAYAELLGRDGHAVVRTRGPISRGTLDPSTTFVVFDPEVFSEEDSGALLNFVVNGGRLVIGGTSPSYFPTLRDVPPEWQPSGPTRWSKIDPALAPITRIASAGDGSFSNIGTTKVIVGSPGEALVTQAAVGQGTVVFVADPSPLQNQLLATGDNAALGLALAGEAGRTVVFPEGVHGYGPSRGIAAIPNDWKVALAGLGLAGLTLMWARGRRLGPAEDTSRDLPPRRAAYVDAVGSTLARTHRPDESLEIIARKVRQHIDARAVSGADGAAGATADLDRAEFARRGHALGMSEEEIAAVLAPITDDSVIAVGRALSRVAQSTGREQE